MLCNSFMFKEVEQRVMPHWSEMRSVYSVSCGVSLVSSLWVCGAEPWWTPFDDDRGKAWLGTGSSSQHAQQRGWLPDGAIFSVPPLSCFSFSAFTSADRQQLEVSKNAWRGKTTRLNQRYGKHKRGGEWPLLHSYGISVCWCDDQSESSLM